MLSVCEEIMSTSSLCKHRPYFPTFSPNMGKYGPKNSEYGRFPCSAGHQRFYTISAKFQLVKNSLIRKSKNYTLLATSSKHVNHDSIRNFVCSKTSYGIITIISWNPELTTNLTKMYLAKHSKNLRIRTNSSYRLAIQWKYTRAYNTASRYCNCFWKLYLKVKILQST